MDTLVPSQESTDRKAPLQDNVLAVVGELDLARPYTELRMSNGQFVRLPTEILLRDEGAQTRFSNQPADLVLEKGDASLVVPIVEEQLTVGKRTVATGTVRLEKTVQEYQQALDEPLAVRTFDIERVVLNRAIDIIPEIRQEGDTTIYPLIEERLILTKELILKEELRITKRDSERRDTQVVTLRREHMTVERRPAEAE